MNLWTNYNKNTREEILKSPWRGQRSFKRWETLEMRIVKRVAFRKISWAKCRGERRRGKRKHNIFVEFCMVWHYKSTKGEEEAEVDWGTIIRLTIRSGYVDPGMAGSIEDEVLLASFEQQSDRVLFLPKKVHSDSPGQEGRRGTETKACIDSSKLRSHTGNQMMSSWTRTEAGGTDSRDSWRVDSVGLEGWWITEVEGEDKG